jgi:hypothetical protein
MVNDDKKQLTYLNVNLLEKPFLLMMMIDQYDIT